MNVDGSNMREFDAELERSHSNKALNSVGSGVYFQYDDEGNTKVDHILAWFEKYR